MTTIPAPTIQDLLDRGEIKLSTRVLGTLPMTADGCIAGYLAEVYEKGQKLECPFKYGMSVVRIGQCYSTRAAAESAARAEKENHE